MTMFIISGIKLFMNDKKVKGEMNMTNEEYLLVRKELLKLHDRAMEKIDELLKQQNEKFDIDISREISVRCKMGMEILDYMNEIESEIDNG